MRGCPYFTESSSTQLPLAEIGKPYINGCPSNHQKLPYINGCPSNHQRLLSLPDSTASMLEKLANLPDISFTKVSTSKET